MERLDQDPSKTKIREVIFDAWKNTKSAFIARKEFLTAIGLITAITALFLNVDIENVFLRRAQVLFLLISILFISWLIISVILSLLRGKHPELYYAVSLIFVFIGILLVVNLFGYIYSIFKAELIFYLKWLGIPFIAIAVNLLSIYFFKFIPKKKTEIRTESNAIESFFLFTLNLYLVTTYYANRFNPLDTLRDLVSFDFANLQLLYIFFLTLYLDLYLIGRIMKGAKAKKTKREAKNYIIVSGLVYIVLILLPISIKYLLPFILISISVR